jgi:hypothetical protein
MNPFDMEETRREISFITWVGPDTMEILATRGINSCSWKWESFPDYNDSHNVESEFQMLSLSRLHITKIPDCGVAIYLPASR